MFRRNSELTVDIWELQNVTVCQRPQSRYGSSASREDQDECELRRKGCAVALNMKFRLPLDYPPVQTRAIVTEDLNTIRVAAQSIEKTAVRPIAGISHQTCAATFTTFVKKANDMCNALHDVDEGLASLFNSEN